jgi:ubiquinone/menaquinone biosynthesis C-methylase UbiE
MNIGDSKIQTKQADIFLESEGNGWFERNKIVVNNTAHFYETETIKRVLQFYQDGINAVCEIGSGNGAKLHDLCKFFNAFGKGIDPSINAVNAGNETYANINLKVSTATNLPFSDAEFDLVYFGFCLYLVDRSDIYKAVAEADRILKNGGFLAILDFDPAIRHKNPYQHKLGVFSYKNSYSDFFTSSGHYYLVAKESFSHGANHFSTDSNERVSVTILYKELDTY